MKLLRDINAPADPPPAHIDDFLDNTHRINTTELAYAHFVFSFFRQPAVVRMLHRKFMSQFPLFVDHEGETYRVTGASRLGDIWLTTNFEQESGYEKRVDLDLSKQINWRDKADFPLNWRQRWLVGRRFYGIDPAGPEVPKKRSALVKELDAARVGRTLLDLSPGERRYVLTEVN